MKRIIAIAVLLLVGIALDAQNINNVEILCNKAKVAAQDNLFDEALKNYDAAVAIITQSNRPDLIVNLNDEIVDYLIPSIAKADKEKAKRYAEQVFGLRMECLAFYARNGYFESKGDYVEVISNVAINMGYTLAEAGVIDGAEQYFLSGVGVFQQTDVFTLAYPLAQEVLGDFYTKYMRNPGKGLDLQYEAFKTTVALSGIDSDVSHKVFGRICTTYGYGLAYYSFAGNVGKAQQYPSLPVYSYKQILGLTDSWTKLRDDIIRTYSADTFTALLKINPVNTIGDSHVQFGSVAHDALFKALSAIHYGQIEEYELWIKEMFGNLPYAEDRVAYADCLVEALCNHGYINNAFLLYNTLQADLVQGGHEKLALEQRLAEASLMYSFGQYEYAWSLVSDFPQKYPDIYVQELILISNLFDRFKNNLPAAEETINKAIAIAESDNGIADRNCLPVLYNNLSTILYRRGEYERSKEAVIRAIEYREQWAVENGHAEAFENGIIWPALEYGNLANNNLTLGNLGEAERLLLSCLSYYNTYYPDSGELQGIYDGLVELYKRKGETEKMLTYAESALNHLVRIYLSASRGMTKIQRTDYWYKTDYGFFDVNSQFALECPLFAGLAYNSALIEKGFLLRLDRAIQTNVRQSGNVELISALDEYKNAELHGLETKKQLEDRLMYLYLKHPEFCDSISFYSWQDVQARLKKHDIAIEFATCCSDGKNVTYAAIMIRRGWPEPKIVALGPEEKFNRILRAGAKAYRNSEDLYSLVWKHIEPYLYGVKNIYFSPQGAVSQINIEILENENGTAVNRRYNVYRLSSTGSLCEPRQSAGLNSATLYGGLNYDTSVSELVKLSRSYSAIEQGINTAFETGSDLTRKGWNYLPGTEREIMQIGKIFAEKKINYLAFSESQGTEESFKSLSGHATPIIHIATHGFFLGDKKKAGDGSHTYPLKRCGLVLSGGQHAWLGESLPNGVEDGILTGEEIAGMNLSDVDLVVLSACQTGLGDIVRDGIYGLQRGFKIAGVGTVIMSLWEVSDEATELMMAKFYSYITSGKTKRDAFDSAVAAVKSKFNGPEYWAAFIMLD